MIRDWKALFFATEEQAKRLCQSKFNSLDALDAAT